MASYYKRLKSDLNNCIDAQIIDRQTAEKIYTKVYSPNLLAQIKAAQWLAIIAGIFIASGLSLIIAHNWETIPNIAKMASFLLIYAAVAIIAIKTKETKPTLNASLEILWFFLPIIGIGLYAQIFNLSGDPAKPYLIWAILSFPLAFLSQRKILTSLHILLLFGLLFFNNFNAANVLSLKAKAFQEFFQIIPWLLSISLIVAAFFQFFRKLKEKSPHLIIGISLFWVLLLFTFNTPFELHAPGFKFLTAMSLSIIWLLSCELLNAKKFLSIVAWLFFMYITTFLWHSTPKDYLADKILPIAFSSLISISTLFFIFLSPLKAIPNILHNKIVKIFLACSIIIFFPLILSQEVAIFKTVAILANIMLLSAGILFILSGSKEFNEKRINYGVVVIFLVVITRFFDIFGTLLKSGVAFIITGIVMIFLSYLLNKGRKAIIEAAKNNE
jgi:uncharacterized membrane protein